MCLIILWGWRFGGLITLCVSGLTQQSSACSFFQSIEALLVNLPQHKTFSLRGKCPNTEFFLVRIFVYSNWIPENTDWKKLSIWTLFTQCMPPPLWFLSLWKGLLNPPISNCLTGKLSSILVSEIIKISTFPLTWSES